MSTMRPSPALIVGLVALVLAMSGAAIALPGKDTVGSNDIKDNAVRSKQIKGKSVKGSDVQGDALKGKQIFEDKLGPVPEAKSVQTVTPLGGGFERVAATDGADTPTARGNAPKVALASRGQLSVYAKCFRNTTTDTTFARVYIETGADGAVFESSAGGQLEGTGGFLDVGSDENDRELLAASAGTDGATFDIAHWDALAPDGTGLGGDVAAGAKNGNVPGDGVFGAGNVCLFGGNAIG
jgi:hypothetical protein